MSLQQVLWFVSLALAAGLAIKLAVSRLDRVYRWFFVFLCFEVLQTLLMLPFVRARNLYALLFLATQPLIWLLYILMVLELYSLALRKHQGIATLGRWAMMGATVIAMGIAMLSLSADLSRPAGPYAWLVYYSVIERGIMSSLVAFLLLITLFLVWYPVSMRRNIVLHASVISMYLLCSALVLFIRNVTGYELTRAISTALLFVQNCCFLLWILFLNRKGEERTVVVRRKWQAQDEEELVRQLDAINAVLLGSSRK